MQEILYIDKGRVTIPKESRQRYGITDGSRIVFFETKSGAFVLKPIKEKPELSLVEHLQRFKGIEFRTESVHVRPQT